MWIQISKRTYNTEENTGGIVRKLIHVSWIQIFCNSSKVRRRNMNEWARLKGFALKVRQFYVDARPFPVILVCQKQRFRAFLNPHFNCNDFTVFLGFFWFHWTLIRTLLMHLPWRTNLNSKRGTFQVLSINVSFFGKRSKMQLIPLKKFNMALFNFFGFQIKMFIWRSDVPT